MSNPLIWHKLQQLFMPPALEPLQPESDINFILMDLVMRGLSGSRATTAIHQQNPPLSCPIVIVSADIRAETRAECLAAGCAAFLEKPTANHLT